MPPGDVQAAGIKFRAGSQPKLNAGPTTGTGAALHVAFGALHTSIVILLSGWFFAFVWPAVFYSIGWTNHPVLWGIGLAVAVTAVAALHAVCVISLVQITQRTAKEVVATRINKSGPVVAPPGTDGEDGDILTEQMVAALWEPPQQ